VCKRWEIQRFSGFSAPTNTLKRLRFTAAADTRLKQGVNENAHNNNCFIRVAPLSFFDMRPDYAPELAKFGGYPWVFTEEVGFSIRNLHARLISGSSVLDNKLISLS